MAMTYDSSQQQGADLAEKWAVFRRRETEHAGPTPHHKILTQDEGTWDSTVQIFAGPPGARPLSFQGLETYKVMNGGLWTMAEIHGDHHIVGVYGYDTNKNKYVGTWIESTNPFRVLMEGDYDEPGRTLTMIAHGVDPVTRRQVREKQIITHTDDDTRKLSLYRLEEDGRETKILEATAKRRK